MSEQTPGEYWAVVGNGVWGLWYGRVAASDEDIAASASVRLYDCRHIRLWYGRRGGITSLAAYGPCGPQKNDSRIGAPTASSLILDVKAVHRCSPEAVEAFDTVVTHEQ